MYSKTLVGQSRSGAVADACDEEMYSEALVADTYNQEMYSETLVADTCNQKMYSETLVAHSSYSWCYIAFEHSELSSESNWEFHVAEIVELQLPVVAVGFLQYPLHPPLPLLPLPLPLPGSPEVRQQAGSEEY